MNASILLYEHLVGQDGGASRTTSGSTARENLEPGATVYSTEHRQPPSANVQSEASPRYQRPSSWRTSTGIGSAYRRHQLVTRSTARQRRSAR